MIPLMFSIRGSIIVLNLRRDATGAGENFRLGRDCMVPHDHALAKNAPVGLDYLCDECRDHFEKVKAYLDINDVAYTVNPKIVRGLDYYTKTVFEFICDDIGAQSTVCGGGRYDGLMEELGGNPMPGLGFGMGIERLLLTLDKQGVDIPQPESCDVFIASIGEEAGKKASALAIALRRAGLYAEFDVVGRGLKAQMKYANKIGAKFSLVLGDNELEENKANIKNMQSGEQTEISLSPDEFLDSFMGLKLTNDFKEG